MISLRKYIDAHAEADKDAPNDDSALSAYRAALLTMSACSERAVPGLGGEMSRQLSDLHHVLSRMATPDVISGAAGIVSRELTAWADLASAQHVENVREIREIIQVVARTGESVTQRDEKYARQFDDLNSRLAAIARMNDLPVIRWSILESTRELKACVEQMVEDSRESMTALAGEVSVYRERLEESERRSATDSLTHLANRREFERRLDDRIRLKAPFCLLMADLNDFKSVNDRHGHLAGDDLLHQFAEELRAQFRPTDIVARWGGDEFAAIIGAGQADADACAGRIRRWAFGDYKITSGGQVVKVPVDASIGVVQWNGRETAAQLTHRADRAVYAGKRTRGSSGVTR